MNFNKYKRNFLIFPIGAMIAMLCFAFVIPHKYYFSLSEIKVDTKKKSLSVSCKLFTDDLESALFKINKKKIDLSISLNDKSVQMLLHKYIVDRFKISITNQPIKLSFVGFEIEDDVTWCYLESIVNSKSSKSVKITNTLLYDYLPEQTNLIQFQWNETRKSEKINSPNKEVTFTF